MKKITWLTFICTALLGILLLCCTNGLSSEASVKGDGVEVGDQLTISIHADENLEIFAKPEANRKSRTISSEAFSIDTSTGLKYYLWGKATNGQVLKPRTVEVSSTDGITGKVILDIDCFNWELTLAATQDTLTLSDDYDEMVSAVKKEAILIGSATVDMVFTNTIEFTLSPKGLTKLGAVALTIAREGNWAIPEGYEVTAGIYDITTGEEIPVYNPDGTLNDTGNTKETLTDLGSGESAPIAGKFVPDDYTIPTPYVETTATYTAGGNKIAPGTYLFQISLKKTGENREYVWNDTIIVLPGKTSDMINIIEGGGSTNHIKSKLLVIPNLIGEKPAAPKDLQVVISDPDTDASGYYTATFSWDGSEVKTETNFALEIIELADSQEGYKADEIGDATWATLIENAENHYCFDYLNDLRKDPRFYKDGSLFANNTEVKVLLELGKRYLARLRSENNAGYSVNATYICTADATDTSKFYYNDINRYRITYHLQGGTWETAAAASTQLDQIDYDTQSDDGHLILEPKGPDGTYPYLHDGAAAWLYWTQGLDGEKYPTDTSVTPNVLEKYKGYKNLDLYAKYSREGNVTVYDDNDYDIFQDYLEGLKQGDTPTDITKNNKITISKALTQSEGTGSEEKKYTEVSIMLPPVATEDLNDPRKNWKYDKVIFEVTYGGRTYVADEQVGAARGTANTFKFYLTNFQTGYVYNCKITAHYQRTVVSYPFALYLTD